MSGLAPRTRLAVAAVIALIVVAGGVYLLFLRGSDAKPVTEAGSRFGDDSGSRSGGTLLDALAPVLDAANASERTGSDPAPPSQDEIRRSPDDAVAGLFMVGFAGTLRDTPFLGRLATSPYGAVLLSSGNYEQPQQLSGLISKIQEVARSAGHPAPLVAVQQEGGDFNAFANLAPAGQVDVGAGSSAQIAASATAAAAQLRALGVSVNLAPNADIAVAGGPGQGRAFSDSVATVTSAVKTTVAAYDKAGVAAVVGPFPGDGAAPHDPSTGPAPVGLSIKDLRSSQMPPFAAVAKGAVAAPAVQMSNAIYGAYDGVTPATLLPDAIKELRGRLGFGGTIVSADLAATTATAGGTVGAAAIRALSAGVDMLVVSGGHVQQDEAYRAVVAAVRAGTVSAGRVADALGHIAKLRAFTRDAREPAQIR